MTSVNTTLQSCPDTPNCVSSQTQGSYYIALFGDTRDETEAFARFSQILARRADASIISTDEAIIRVEFRTVLGFVDDAIFVLDKSEMVIHVRSAARSGYWDLGKNRHRVEEIRQEFLRGG